MVYGLDIIVMFLIIELFLVWYVCEKEFWCNFLNVYIVVGILFSLILCVNC